MCYTSACLGYLLLAVLVGFAVLIYFLLRHRKRLLADNIQISPDQVWDSIVERAKKDKLLKADLIYGIYQDKTNTTWQSVVKNSKGELIGYIEQPLAARKTFLILGNEKYQIEYPLTWRKRAYLKTADGKLLATFERLPFSFRNHKFMIQDLGTLYSESPRFNFQYPFKYKLNGNLIGITQGISKRPIGSIAIMPSKYPLSIRVFILAMNVTGV